MVDAENQTERNICITAADGQTGFLIAELILTNPDFSSKVDSVTALTLHPTSAKCKQLEKLGAKIVPHKPGRVRDMVKTLQSVNCDTICLIPPTHKDKFDITTELIEAAKKSDVPNVVFFSSAGADLAERDKQPRLREFVDLEALVMATKGNTSTQAGHSPVIIRAGFYTENLLIYGQQAQKEGLLPLPIGDNHKFAPVALGDVAQVAAHVLTGKGEHGLDDKHRGQLMVITGPQMVAGNELAEAANQAMGTKLEFENISEAEAKRVLHTQGHHDESEREYLLEYYSLVREGKTNYIATTAFVNVTGNSPQMPEDFFKVYYETFTTQKGQHKGGVKAKKEEDDTAAKQEHDEAKVDPKEQNAKVADSNAEMQEADGDGDDDAQPENHSSAKKRQQEGGRKGGQNNSKKQVESKEQNAKVADGDEEMQEADGDGDADAQPENHSSAKKRQQEGGRKGGQNNSKKQVESKEHNAKVADGDEEMQEADGDGDADAQPENHSSAKKRQQEGGRKGGQNNSKKRKTNS